MLWFFRQFWRALVAVGTWLGLFFLAKDVYELPEALKAWGPLMPDRETALAIFSGLLVLWIAWIDVRPFVQKYLAGRSPIEIEPNIYCESKRFMEAGNGTGQQPALWENIFYLVVRNRAHPTIRNVSVHLHTIEDIERCPIKDGHSFSADIRHGDSVFFRMGRVISSEMSSFPRPPGDRVTSQEMFAYFHNVAMGVLAF